MNTLFHLNARESFRGVRSCGRRGISLPSAGAPPFGFKGGDFLFFSPTRCEREGLCRGGGCFRPLFLFASILFFAAAFFLLAPALRASDRVEWKPYDNAFLRIDEHPPADWNLYHVGKKDDRLLLQLGVRFLLILVKDQQVYELDPKKLERKGNAIFWHEDDRPDKPLASSLWTFHDIGLAWHIEFHIDAEGRAFSIELPHPPDVRAIY
jgi:hypothetical protein